MRQAVLRILLGAALGSLIFVGVLYADHDIGVPAGSLERDLRTSQRENACHPCPGKRKKSAVWRSFLQVDGLSRPDRLF